MLKSPCSNRKFVFKWWMFLPAMLVSWGVCIYIYGLSQHRAQPLIATWQKRWKMQITRKFTWRSNKTNMKTPQPPCQGTQKTTINCRMDLQICLYMWNEIESPNVYRINNHIHAYQYQTLLQQFQCMYCLHIDCILHGNKAQINYKQYFVPPTQTVFFVSCFCLPSVETEGFFGTNFWRKQMQITFSKSSERYLDIPKSIQNTWCLYICLWYVFGTPQKIRNLRRWFGRTVWGFKLLLNKCLDVNRLL